MAAAVSPAAATHALSSAHAASGTGVRLGPKMAAVLCASGVARSRSITQYSRASCSPLRHSAAHYSRVCRLPSQWHYKDTRGVDYTQHCIR